ncbi:Protein tyrosine kinase/Protein kinase domain/Fungal protein kinase, putative [Leishmania shawi]|uniref:Protein kinase domain-containing protein n=1 Tax=Leishmania shawi TaxID=5680 RepID=A0ABR3EF27_9TRYP
MTTLPFPLIEDIGELYMLDDIYDFLGEGTFATVFKAVSTMNRDVVKENQTVALKMIAKRNLSSDKLVRDVINEVHALRQTAHPNCVRFIECVQTPLYVVIVTEYVEGVELFQALKEQKFTEAMVLNVMRQLLSALAYLHNTLHIVHRDVKPENVIITTQETPFRVVLVDFGLVRSCERQRPRISRELATQFQRQRSMPLPNMSVESLDCDSPMLATPCGTLKYAAPETVQSITQSAQLSTTKKLLSRLDVYAAGVIMYVMLSGALPFKNFANKANLVMEMRNSLSFEGPRWAGISAEAIDLNRALLNFDAVSRPRAAEALQYPWFKIYGSSLLPMSAEEAQPTPGNPLESSICERGAMTQAFEAMRDTEAAMYYSEEETTTTSGPVASYNGLRTPNSRCVSVPFGTNMAAFASGSNTTTASRTAESGYFDFA